MKTLTDKLLLAFLLAVSCTAGTPDPVAGSKIGVLLVNHGSRSATWRQALLDLETAVRPRLLANPAIRGVKTAHMEYTEPSIATRMKEFDAEGYSDVVVVPVFLSVSSHTFDDIPTILGEKTDPHSLETMRIEKIERYAPRARTSITPNLDFTELLKANVLRRAKALSSKPEEEGLVMIAYGDATYEREWSALLGSVAEHVKASTGIAVSSHGWCGHVAHYDPDKTTQAIAKVLETRKRAVVVPVLVARDEMFQVKIIGDGIAKVPGHETRVVYRPDSILPDEGVERWVVAIAGEFAAKVRDSRRVASGSGTGGAGHGADAVVGLRP